MCHTVIEVTVMPQLHFYVPDEVAQLIQERAKAKNLSVSRFIAETMQREIHAGWPEGYFEKVVGEWQGEFKEPEDLPLEARDPLF
jgi:post-segregation antitoxin (ccd killing protein)